VFQQQALVVEVEPTRVMEILEDPEVVLDLLDQPVDQELLAKEIMVAVQQVQVHHNIQMLAVVVLALLVRILSALQLVVRAVQDWLIQQAVLL
jgi:hypothetical protein